MELRIVQKRLKWTYEYKIYHCTELMYVGRANRAIILTPREIQLLNQQGNILFKLKQDNIWKFVFEYLAWVLIPRGYPYHVYQNDVVNGQLVRYYNSNSADIHGAIDGNEYAIHIHTGNRFSIFINNEQVALVERKCWKKWDGDEYVVLLSQTCDTEIIILLCLMIDVEFHTVDTSINQFSWEYNPEAFDQRKGAVNWRPSD